MPLTPPPNYTKAVLAVAIGVSLALLVGLYTRSTLPHVGDLSHSLPHGGFYADGTKTVSYGGPRKLNSVEGAVSNKHYAWALVLVLTALILALSGRSHSCDACRRN